MLTLRFQTSIATDRGYFHEGRTIDVTSLTSEMREWIRRGAAILTRGSVDGETAVAVEDPERAVLSQPVGRRARRAAAVAS